MSRDVTGLFSARYFYKYYLQSVQKYIKNKRTFLVSFQFIAKLPSRIACTETIGFISLFLIIRIPLPDYAELRQCEVLAASETL